MLYLVDLIRIICVVTLDVINGDMLMHTCMSRRLRLCFCTMGYVLISLGLLSRTPYLVWERLVEHGLPRG